MHPWREKIVRTYCGNKNMTTAEVALNDLLLCTFLFFIDYNITFSATLPVPIHVICNVCSVHANKYYIICTLKKHHPMKRWNTEELFMRY